MVQDSVLQWLQSGEYLPEFMQDFHDQKDLFKTIHELYGDGDTSKMPNWVEAHCYTVDWFLWFMASRGYTLQKCRKNLPFSDLQETLERGREERMGILRQMLGGSNE